MNAYDLQAVSSLVSDDGQPDFVVNSTLSGWWEQTNKYDFFAILVLEIIIGITIHIFYSWLKRKYNQYIENGDCSKDSDKNNDEE